MRKLNIIPISIALLGILSSCSKHVVYQKTNKMNAVALMQSNNVKSVDFVKTEPDKASIKTTTTSSEIKPLNTLPNTSRLSKVLVKAKNINPSKTIINRIAKAPLKIGMDKSITSVLQPKTQGTKKMIAYGITAIIFWIAAAITYNTSKLVGTLLNLGGILFLILAVIELMKYIDVL